MSKSFANVDAHMAAEKGSLETLTTFIAAGGDLNCRGLASRTPLHLAAEHGQSEAARLLLEAKAAVDPQDVRGNTPLHRAVYFGKGNVAKVLLEFGADPTALNDAGLRPGKEGGFHRQVQQDTRNDIEALVAQARKSRAVLAHGGAEELGDTNVHDMVRRGDVGALEVYISRGGDIEARDENGFTPLLAAVGATEGSKVLEVVKILLKAGAKTSVGDRLHRQPLLLAAGWGRTEVARELLSSGADVMARNKQGQTSLHLAAQFGKTDAAAADIVSTLLDAGAEAGAADSVGNTPLHLASAAGRKGVVMQLCIKGADAAAQNRKGARPGDEFLPSVPLSQQRAILRILNQHRPDVAVVPLGRGRQQREEERDIPEGDGEEPQDDAGMLKESEPVRPPSPTAAPDNASSADPSCTCCFVS
jgi:ankyrin repeat protein